MLEKLKEAKASVDCGARQIDLRRQFGNDLGIFLYWLLRIDRDFPNVTLYDGFFNGKYKFEKLDWMFFDYVANVLKQGDRIHHASRKNIWQHKMDIILIRFVASLTP